MVAKDFREYLEQLEKNGKLVRVRKEVDIRYEIAAGIRKASDNDGPALFFENIRGYPGWRVAGGAYATQKHLAIALGLPIDADEQSILKRYLECEEKRVKPKLVDTGPVKEVIIKGEDVDLTKLPIPTYSEMDSGPYLTAGLEIAKHPDTGIQNVSIHRRKILDKNRTSLLAVGTQNLAQMYAAAEKKGQGLAVATAIGVEPSLAIASQIRVPLGVDETYIAGAFQGAPIEMVKCETIDVEVPANAEIVIEGVTIPDERVIDGPFGEFPGDYITLFGEPQTKTPVVKVTAITMRKNPIFQAVLTGMPVTENHILFKWPSITAIYRQVTKLADVKAISTTPGGSSQFHLIIAINKKDDEEPKNIINTLFSHQRLLKYIIVVDEDINVYNPLDVEWAMATRMWADKDFIIIPRTAPENAAAPHHSAFRPQWGIDATAPIKDRQWYKKVSVPGVEKVDYF